MNRLEMLGILTASAMLAMGGSVPQSSIEVGRFTQQGVRGQYSSQYTSKESLIKAGSALNEEICDEGMVLLKNKDKALPFKNEKNISLFGKASVNFLFGGGGSGSGRVNGEEGTGSGWSVKPYSLQYRLEEAGFTINPDLVAFYSDPDRSGKDRTNGNSGWTGVSEATIGETPIGSYDETVKSSFNSYHDAAVVVITRSGTEGADCKTYDARDHADDPVSTKHYLQLSKNENDMLDMVEASFSKVVVLINSGNIFQCDRFETDDKVSAVLWVGTPGAVGAKAIGRILKGTVNPSGRTVDTWTRDFREDPSFQNFGDNSQTNIINGTAVPQCTMINSDGTPTSSCTKATWVDAGNKVSNKGLNGVYPSSYVSYEEGVYVDYRYYETRYADMEKAAKGSGDAWYAGKEGVIYPFGYGLSYSSFSQQIDSVDPVENTVLTGAKKQLSVTVNVKNTGNVAGKDVVQVYWKAPYTVGGIEKPYEILAAFGKTGILQAGQEEKVTCTFYLQDVASYDYADKNGNGFKGYELDSGDYTISVNENAHKAYDEVHLKVKDGGIQYENDRFTGHKVENRFSGNDFFSSLPLESDVGFDHMTRANFTSSFPSHPTVADRTLKANSRVQEFLTHQFTLADLDIHHNGYVSEAAYVSKDKFTKLGYSQQADALPRESRQQLSEMIGVPLDDPRWDTFLNEFTFDELQTFVTDGAFHNPAMDAIGKPNTTDSDGPSQFEIIWWAGAPTVAATYNVELAKQQGEIVGTESYFAKGWFGGSTCGWLGPAVDTHRSPFGGRNFEYYSADPLLMGKIASSVVKAATKKGVYCYFKHFAVNEQETNREGTSVFVDEQALREIYLKPFQMVIEEAKCRGIMSSYNRLGNMETAASYPLLTEVLRDEWGMKGAVLSDMTHHGNTIFDHKAYENINNRALSGCNAQLDNSNYSADVEAKWDQTANDGKGAPVFTYTDEGGQTKSAESYSWWYTVRKLAKEMLYISSLTGAMQPNLAYQDSEAVTCDKQSLQIDINKSFEATFAIADKYRVGQTYEGKTITAVALAIDPLTPLPDGLTYHDGKITGTPTVTGAYEINLIVELTVEGSDVPSDTSSGSSSTPEITTATTDVISVFEMNVVDPANPDVEPSTATVPVGLIVGLSVGGAVVLGTAGFFLIRLRLKKKAKAKP